MVIERLQVEEGFLQGLDVQFSSGLNVLIGPRGTGKTSVLELLRFCLGSAAFTERVESQAYSHALSILESGSATVTFRLGQEKFVTTRTSTSDSSNLPPNFAPPLILSQNEIETVGLSPRSRLALLDSVAKTAGSQTSASTPLVAKIRSQTHEYRALMEEVENFRAQEKRLVGELTNAEEVKKSHAAVLQQIENSSPDAKELEKFTAWILMVGTRFSVLGRVEQELLRRHSELTNVVERRLQVEPWPQSAQSEDPLAVVRGLVGQSDEAVAESLKFLDEALAKVGELKKFSQNQVHQFEESARLLRIKLEALQKGAGESARRLAAIQEKAGQLIAIRETIGQRSTRISQLQQARGELLEKLESLRTHRFEQRKQAVEKLNAALGPRIRITVERGGILDDYAQSLTDALRGTGLKFNDSVQAIVDNISPREFIETVELGDADALADLTGLAAARCVKIIERINSSLADQILVADVEDGVAFWLLDGLDYKDSESLSTGQRCTIVLPLVLQQENLCLIVDQPEDHLDNGFIAETLIQAIKAHADTGQIIFATHNANIPVLGEASRVTLLGSDGSRGHKVFSGPLFAKESVDAISKIMEGGRDAFQRRGAFYSSQGTSPS